jgi:glycosyltransferase involved in cell wall biosynthesis
MNILHVITTLDVGGAEMHLKSQVQGQSAAGHQVRVAYLKGAGSLTDDFIEAGAESVHPVSPSAPWKLWKHLRWAHVVHSHLLKADVFTALLATLAGRRRCLLSGKHNDEQVLTRPMVSRVHGVIGRLPRVTVVLSDHVGRFIEEHGRVPRARQERIYYGIDPTRFEAAAADGAARAESRSEFGWGPDEVVAICVARFAAQKAHDVLLRAFAEAATTAPNLRLLLVGDDPFGDGRQRAEALAAELELGDRVHFAGIRRDVPALLAASDLFVMASLWEGLGLVFLEAMAAGLPVLSTRVSAIPEVVVEGETGVLVPPGEVSPLAAGLVDLARDPERRATLAAAGRARVRELFGLERMWAETLDLYARVRRP